MKEDRLIEKEQKEILKRSRDFEITISDLEQEKNDISKLNEYVDKKVIAHKKADEFFQRYNKIITRITSRLRKWSKVYNDDNFRSAIVGNRDFIKKSGLDNLFDLNDSIMMATENKKKYLSSEIRFVNFLEKKLVHDKQILEKEERHLNEMKIALEKHFVRLGGKVKKDRLVL